MSGSIGILNVGAGDTKLSFDKSNPAERIRAARIVTDMLRRGYALLVEVEQDGKKVFRRATAFDENTCEYVIADFDPIAAQLADEAEAPHEQAGQKTTEIGTPAPDEGPAKRGRPKLKHTRIAASGTRGVAVSRSAGG